MHVAADRFPALGLTHPSDSQAAGPNPAELVASQRSRRRDAREHRLRRRAEAAGVGGLRDDAARQRPSGGGIVTRVELTGRRRVARTVTATFVRHPFGEALVRVRVGSVSGRTRPLRP